MNIRWKHESLVLVKDGSFLFSGRMKQDEETGRNDGYRKMEPLQLPSLYRSFFSGILSVLRKIKVCDIRETPVTAQGHSKNAFKQPGPGLAIMTLKKRRSRI